MKHNKIINSILIGFLSIFLLVACNDFVQNIDEPIDNIDGKVLNTPGDIQGLAVGLLNTWSLTWDEHSLFMDGMSDAMGFTRDIRQATYTSYEALDLAEIAGKNPLNDQNNSTAAIFSQLGRLRLLSDTLITRINSQIKFDEKNETEIGQKFYGLYVANFMGAVARYMYGVGWALTPERPGGVINRSGLITDKEMFAEAIKRLDEAMKYTGELQVRQLNTLKARIYLIQGMYAEAKAAADLGMKNGDDSFDAKYNTFGDNQWYTWAGPGRSQFHASMRFGTYVYEDPNEANRLPLYYIMGGRLVFLPENDTVIGGHTYKAGVKSRYYYPEQKKYTAFGSPIQFLSWQENNLMLAELAIRSGDNATALQLINEVRSPYYLSPITDEIVTSNYGGNYLDLIYVERDKQLAFTGIRLIDQRRFDKWHKDKAQTWQYMPIPDAEKLSNPNLK